MATIDPQILREAYHGILELGLENLQRASLPDLHDYLRVEIDHLHNIPSYMYDDNLFRHAYYFCTERPSYLERVVEFPTISIDYMLMRYTPHWDSLHAELLPFAGIINAKHYTKQL